MHSAVLIYKEVLGKKLSDKLLPNQIEAIERQVREWDNWRDCVDTWSMRGYNPTNVDGMLEWYHEGIPNSKKELIDDGEWER